MAKPVIIKVKYNKITHPEIKIGDVWEIPSGTKRKNTHRYKIKKIEDIDDTFGRVYLEDLGLKLVK
jgi:hypothetical protein